MTVTREPEWDDYERDKMLALGLYEAGICECGFHESIADQDPNLDLDVRVCPVCTGLAPIMRKLDAEDGNARRAQGQTPDPTAPLPSDGRHVRLRPKSDVADAHGVPQATSDN